MSGLSPALCDAVPARWSLTDRGLTCRVRPTYVGIRPYMTADGRRVRVLRRGSQVNAPAHLDTMRRLVGTRRHPSREGRRVFLSATAEPGSPAPWDETVELWPHKDYFVGSVGDAIDLVDVPGLGLVPEFAATVTDRETLADIKAGATDVSYGYVGWFVGADEVPIEGEVVGPGQWKNPSTGQVEEFDVECLVDPTDPRIPPEMRDSIGGNHLAFAVPAGAGRGGREVRLLLDDAAASIGASGEGCRVFALRRTVDESGVSGTGVVAVVLASPTDDGPACALWTTATNSAVAYDTLHAMRAIHVDAHAEGANELVPLTLGWPGDEPADDDQDELPADAGEDKMADTNAPAGGGEGGDLAAQLKAKGEAYDALMVKYNELVAQMETMKTKLAESATAKAAADTAKAQAQATADSLLEQLAPIKARELEARRQADMRLLGAKGELADRISKATADELPGVVVRAYYEQNPALRGAVSALDEKLADVAYVRARYEVLHEQAPRLSLVESGPSRGFADSFERRPDREQQREELTTQQKLDRMQREQNGGA